MTRAARFPPWVPLFAFVLSSSLCYADLHPTRVEENSNCLECHADHATGEHVHPAVKLGCASCHSIENREDSSYVVLKPVKAILCRECHPPAALQRPHFPYASGMCLRCHDPHTSVNPHLLRAKVNDLCLECHLRTASSTPSRFLPTIYLSSDKTMGHPYERHPVSGSRDPLTGGEMSCISCHLAHGGGKVHYLKMAAEIPEDALNQSTEIKDMCHKCHLQLWGLDGASGKKKRKKAK